MNLPALTIAQAREIVETLRLCASLQDFEASKTESALLRAEYRGAVVAFRQSARMLEERLEALELSSARSDQATTPHVGVTIPPEARLPPTEEPSDRDLEAPAPWWRRPFGQSR